MTKSGDVRVCSQASKFAIPFTGTGLTHHSRLSATLTRTVDAARASELILIAEPFTAQQALKRGLVGCLTGLPDMLTAARPLPDRLAGLPTLTHAGAKKAIQAAAPPVLPNMLAAEQAGQSRLERTDDYK